MNTTATWNHLPNARHIDQIITSGGSHLSSWEWAWLTTHNSARGDAWGASKSAISNGARDSVWYVAKAAVQLATAGHSMNAMGGAVLALIAYDDSAKYLDMTSDELKMWVVLSEDPAAILLLPAVRAFEQIKELEFT